VPGDARHLCLELFYADVACPLNIPDREFTTDEVAAIRVDDRPPVVLVAKADI
jgi:hypothetical protein